MSPWVNPDVAAVGVDPTDVAVDPAASPLDALVSFPVLPVEDVAGDPSAPRCAADLPPWQDGHSWASQAFWTLPGPMRKAPLGPLA